MKTMRWLIGSICGVAMMGVGVQASALTADLNPTADGDVQVFGGDDVQTGGNINITQSGGLIRNGIFEFDLSAIPDTATINSATFTLTLVSEIIAPFLPAVHDVFAYNGDGVVNVADFNAAATQVIDFEIDAQTNSGLVISQSFSTVTPISDALIGDLLTLRLETDSFNSAVYFSIDTGAGATLPQLSIDFTVADASVPLPAALPLAATGFALLGMIGWRRNTRA